MDNCTPISLKAKPPTIPRLVFCLPGVLEKSYPRKAREHRSVGRSDVSLTLLLIDADSVTNASAVPTAPDEWYLDIGGESWETSRREFFSGIFSYSRASGLRISRIRIPVSKIENLSPRSYSTKLLPKARFEFSKFLGVLTFSCPRILSRTQIGLTRSVSDPPRVSSTRYSKFPHTSVHRGDLAHSDASIDRGVSAREAQPSQKALSAPVRAAFYKKSIVDARRCIGIMQSHAIIAS